MIKLNQHLEIPYDKFFYQLPFSHYTSLAEKISTPNVVRYVRELMLEYKDDSFKSNKARLLLNKLNKTLLTESVTSDTECECGFNTMGEDYDECPMCEKQFEF